MGFHELGESPLQSRSESSASEILSIRTQLISEHEPLFQELENSLDRFKNRSM